MGGESSASTGAVFLSYASQDAEAAQHICEALRSAGVEVWLDQSELRGGDAWDESIRDQIKACALFIPVISANAHARVEGYFRLEWKLAVDRSHRMAPKQPFLLPVVIDDTPQSDDAIPDRFREVQWSRLPDGQATPVFVERVRRLLTSTATPDHPGARDDPRPRTPRDQVGASGHGPAKSHWRRAAFLVLAVLTVAAGVYLTLERSVISRRSASTAPAQKSIAVLPFLDLSERHDQQYFADGMAEEILDVLAKIPQLTVIARTSSFQFKGRTEDLRTIGEKLGAAYVVEGSVRKAGDRVRVTAQLIDAKSGAHLWSDSFDRAYGDVLTLQDEIATAIARALQVTVGAHDARPLPDARATQAYTLYLQGKLALDKFSASPLLDAQNAFQQALQLDPTLLPAAEGLAQTFINRGFDESDISSREAWDQARVAARKALDISARSGIAHSVLGVVAGMRDFDWGTAQREFQTALALSPNDPDAFLNAAQTAAAHGDFEQALGQVNASLVVDPLNPNTHQVRGSLLYLVGDYSAAEAALRKSIEINPAIDGSYLYLGIIQLMQGHLERASKDFAADPDSAGRDAGLALVSHAFGRKTESDAALARLVDSTNNGNIWAYGVALVHAYRGDRDQAFQWLAKARDARGGDLFFLLADPLLKPLHDDPRWLTLLKSMNLEKGR